MNCWLEFPTENSTPDPTVLCGTEQVKLPCPVFAHVTVFPMSDVAFAGVEIIPMVKIEMHASVVLASFMFNLLFAQCQSQMTSLANRELTGWGKDPFCACANLGPFEAMVFKSCALTAASRNQANQSAEGVAASQLPPISSLPSCPESAQIRYSRCKTLPFELISDQWVRVGL
jgi:hypothetical protein